MKLTQEGVAYFAEKVSLRPTAPGAPQPEIEMDLITSPASSPRPMSPIDIIQLVFDSLTHRSQDSPQTGSSLSKYAGLSLVEALEIEEKSKKKTDINEIDLEQNEPIESNEGDVSQDFQGM